MSRVLPIVRSILVLAAMLAWLLPARAGLHEYVQKPEKSWSWKLKEKRALPHGTIYELHLVSQTWQGITWEHQLQVYQPTNVAPNGTMLLWNTGGSASLGTALFGMELARKVKAPCAFLYHVPNQPLFEGKREDALIAETFVRYLQTKDEDWPLLFPMVKSVVKAMDALQAFSKDEWKKTVESFIVSGASKRGWTTWLTGAVDARVKAIAPLVIDTLNMNEQMAHQMKCFGAYSEMIADYTRRGLVPMPDTPEARKLWQMVDPYLYRDKLTQPKLIINGNNDPYWTADALNLYWDGLKGEKYVLYVPNAGHNLQQRGKNDRPDLTRASNGLAAFVRCQSNGKSMPRLQWQHADQSGQFSLSVEANPAPVAARLWLATAPTQDFRKAEWKEQAATVEKGTVKGSVAPPAKGFLAFYAELEYELEDLRYHLSTQLRVAGKKAE